MNTRMKKLTPILGAAVMFGMLIFSQNDAYAVGECANCHVMHASEVGVTSTPNDTLLRDSCLGCHTEVAGSSVGPAVLDAGTDLAGGDFAYVEAGDDRKGHNPSELTNAESSAALASPPGWKVGFTDSTGDQVGSSGAWALDKLTCAGNFGCHGDHSVVNSTQAMKGSHHVNTAGTTTGATLGASYRFLQGIKGIEDVDYEETVGAGDHNVYYGSIETDDVTANQDKDTISYLCAQCHGIFHAGAGNEGISDDTGFGTDPWIRHPVDIDMSIDANDWDYGNNAYVPGVPVASSDLAVATNATNHDAKIADSTAGHRIVMCLSCHRAHASNFESMLRWTKATPKAGQGADNTGCLACHTSVDGVNGY